MLFVGCSCYRLCRNDKWHQVEVKYMHKYMDVTNQLFQYTYLNINYRWIKYSSIPPVTMDIKAISNSLEMLLLKKSLTITCGRFAQTAFGCIIPQSPQRAWPVVHDGALEAGGINVTPLTGLVVSVWPVLTVLYTLTGGWSFQIHFCLQTFKMMFCSRLLT